MIELTVDELSADFCILGGSWHGEERAVLLPRWFLPDTANEGDKVVMTIQPKSP